MVDTGDEATEASRFGPVRRELFWAVPLLLATLALTGSLLLDLQRGAGIATILAVPIGIVGVGVAILAIRLANQPQISGGGLRGRPSLARVISLVATVALLVIWLVNVIWPNQDSVDYLRGRLVKIGVNGNVMGWSMGSSKTMSGFDVVIGNFLARKFGFTPLYIPINPGDRERMLENGEVDLVIASFSITPERKGVVDFAGPYYLDAPATFYYKGKYGKIMGMGKSPAVCLTKGTTAQKDPRWASGGYQIVQEENISNCMVKVLATENPVVGVATDRSILDAYAEGNLSGDEEFIKSDSGGSEEIGVGIKNNHPRLCEEIGKALDEFLLKDWGDAFGEHLKVYGIVERGHRPSQTNPDHCK